MREPLRAILLWVVFAAAYVFCAGDLGVFELVAAALCAGVATAIALALGSVATRHFRALPPLPVVAKMLKCIVADTVAVGAALVQVIAGKSVASSLVEQPLAPETGGGDEGRTALAIIALSLAPQSYVVRRDGDDRLLVHAWPPKPASPNHRWPL